MDSSSGTLIEPQERISDSALQQFTILKILDSHWNPNAQITMTAGELARCLIEHADLTAAAAIKRVIKQYPHASCSSDDTTWAVGKEPDHVNGQVALTSLDHATSLDQGVVPSTNKAVATLSPTTNPSTTSQQPSQMLPLASNSSQTNQIPSSIDNITLSASLLNDTISIPKVRTVPYPIHEWDILLNDKHAIKYSRGSELWAKAKSIERNEVMRRNLSEKRARVQEIFQNELFSVHSLKRMPIFWYKIIINSHHIGGRALGKITGRESNTYRTATDEEICKNVKSYRGTNRQNLTPQILNLPKSDNYEIVSNPSNILPVKSEGGSEGQRFTSITSNGVRKVNMSTYSHPDGSRVIMESIQLVFDNGTTTERYGGIPPTAGAGEQIESMTFCVNNQDAIVKAEVKSGWGTDAVRFTTEKGIVSPWYGGNSGSEISIYTAKNGEELIGIKGFRGWLLDRLEFVFGPKTRTGSNI
uniref:Jacalin-type lectin domain-containing protein n=1 Tax=Chaetoceros debilis TaxID=122233 RepID=A0A7S3V4L7_9STRA